MREIRRVVTGVDAVGTSVVVEDSTVPSFALPAPGQRRHRIWSLDTGVRFDVLTIAPAATRPVEVDGQAPLQSSRIDFVVVLEGVIWLELDARRALRLEAGDTVVQNGGRHAWRNHSDRPCTIALCLIGSKPE